MECHGRLRHRIEFTAGYSDSGLSENSSSSSIHRPDPTAHIPITLADVHGWIPDGTRNKDAFVKREPNDMELTKHQSMRRRDVLEDDSPATM